MIKSGWSWMHETQINFSIVYNLYTTQNPECLAQGESTELCKKCQNERWEMSCYLRSFGKKPWFGLVKSLQKLFPNTRKMGAIRGMALPVLMNPCPSVAGVEMSSSVSEISPLAPAPLGTANILLWKWREVRKKHIFVKIGLS